MSREVPFDMNAKCDMCGCVGAWDFMGDYLCADCFQKLQEEEPDKEKAIKQQAKEQG